MINYTVWGKYPPLPQLIGIVFHLERKKDIGHVAPFQFTLIGSGTKVAINVIVRDPPLARGPNCQHCSVISGFCYVQIPCPKLNSSLNFTNLCRSGKWRLLMLPWGPWVPGTFTSHKVSLFLVPVKNPLHSTFTLRPKWMIRTPWNSFLSSHHTFSSFPPTTLFDERDRLISEE